jgi:hypothetical protein
MRVKRILFPGGGCPAQGPPQVKEHLAVPPGTPHAAFRLSDNGKPGLPGELPDGTHGPQPLFLVADHPPLPDRPFPRLELGFDQRHDVGAGEQESAQRGQDMAQGDEGDVHRGKGNLLREKAGGGVPEIHPLPEDDSRVPAERVVEEGFPHVDREHPRGAPPEEAIREPPGGCSHVERDGTRRNGKPQVVERPGELLSAPRDERPGRRGDGDIDAGPCGGPAFRDDLAGEEDAAGEDETLRLRPGLRKAPGDQLGVQAVPPPLPPRGGPAAAGRGIRQSCRAGPGCR